MNTKNEPVSTFFAKKTFDSLKFTQLGRAQYRKFEGARPAWDLKSKRGQRHQNQQANGCQYWKSD